MATTDTLCVATIDAREFFFFANGETDDNTVFEIKQYLDSGATKSIGEVHKGKKLQRVWAQASDGSVTDQLQVLGDGGEKIWHGAGKERTIGNPHVTLDTGPLNIPITAGMTLQMTTTD